MYHWVRTYSARIGKAGELLALSKDAVAHLEKTLNIKAHNYSAVGGNPMEFMLHGVYDSLGAIGEAEKKLAGDSGWEAIMKKAEPLVVEGSAQDQFWKENN